MSERFRVSFKHQMGRHPQKRHGWRMAFRQSFDKMAAEQGAGEAMVKDISLAERWEFTQALERAGTFESLPKKYQALILAAEGQPAKKERNWLRAHVRRLKSGRF